MKQTQNIQKSNRRYKIEQDSKKKERQRFFSRIKFINYFMDWDVGSFCKCIEMICDLKIVFSIYQVMWTYIIIMRRIKKCGNFELFEKLQIICVPISIWIKALLRPQHFKLILIVCHFSVQIGTSFNQSINEWINWHTIAFSMTDYYRKIEFPLIDSKKNKWYL